MLSAGNGGKRGAAQMMRGIAATRRVEPAPVDWFQEVMLEEAGVAELVKDASALPFDETAVSGTAGAQIRQAQRVPVAVIPQHKEDGIHDTSVVQPAAVASQRVRRWWLMRKQFAHGLPQGVRDAQAIISWKICHFAVLWREHSF